MVFALNYLESSLMLLLFSIRLFGFFLFPLRFLRFFQAKTPPNLLTLLKGTQNPFDQPKNPFFGSFWLSSSLSLEVLHQLAVETLFRLGV